ncbi:hypothetical protein ACLI1A_17835 [Flavobacterium sp. RHBU_3]|uniref:hypothetical protein n=1 Tax=Flavobacterium sp. RHBU_3 TaxID=3391184 RepID=UPI0039855407
MILITSKYLVPKGYSGITLFPFVFMRDKSLAANPVFINHERIHLRQQAELLVLPFYIWYITEYFIRRLHYPTQKEAYRNISFEREAYGNETNKNYLTNRKWFAFFRYLKL